MKMNRRIGVTLALALLMQWGSATAVQAGPEVFEGIHSAFADDAGKEVTVSWMTGPASRPEVLYGRSASTLDMKQTATSLPLGKIVVHHARLSGLEPGVRYYYQCVMGDPVMTSRVCSVKTAPVPGQPVRFAVLGDIQVKGRNRNWQHAAQWLADQQPDFCVSLGDQVDQGLVLEQWQGLFADGAPLFESMAFMPLIGNHDIYGEGPVKEQYPALYFTLFPLPTNGLPAFEGQWYSFRAGDAAFTMLASYPFQERQPCDVRKVPEQTVWLKGTLARNEAEGWSFVGFHPPVYSSGDHGGDTAWYQGLWGDLMEQERVAVVFNGHTHAFEVTHPLRQGKRVSDGSGVIYYNGAGISYSALAKGNERTAARAQQVREPLALLATVTPDRLVLNTWNMESNIVAYETVILRGDKAAISESERARP